MVDWHGKGSSKCSPLQIYYKEWNISLFSKESSFGPSPPTSSQSSNLSFSLTSHAQSRRLSNTEETWVFNFVCALLAVFSPSPELERATPEARSFSTRAVQGNQKPPWHWAEVISRDRVKSIAALRRGIMASSPLLASLLTGVDSEKLLLQHIRKTSASAAVNGQEMKLLTP